MTILGYDKADDGAVYKLSNDMALIQTLDFFTPMTEDPFRTDFPGDPRGQQKKRGTMEQRMIYLDNAATTLVKPDCVYAFIEGAKCFSNMGRGVSQMSIRTSQAAYEARSELADLFNISNPLQIGFTKNATEALNVGIYGLLEKGDHVVTTVCEHNSVLRPLFRMKEDRGIDITLVECDRNGDISPKDIRKAVRSNTRLFIGSEKNRDASRQPVLL